MKTFKQFQEGIKTKLAIGGLMALPFAMQKVKDKFDPIQKLRDKKQTEKPNDGYIGPKFLGIKSIAQRRKEFQDKKATEYEKKSGTTKEDGYFR